MINNFGEKIEEARKRECDLMVNNLANITQVEKEKYTKKRLYLVQRGHGSLSCTISFQTGTKKESLTNRLSFLLYMSYQTACATESLHTIGIAISN